MTDRFPADFDEQCWARLPMELRQRGVAILHAEMAPAFFADVRKFVDEEGLGKWMPPGWHFAQGMGIRNLLRDGAGRMPGIPDRALPDVGDLYPDGQGGGVRNWDDFYVPLVECAAGVRDLARVTVPQPDEAPEPPYEPDDYYQRPWFDRALDGIEDRLDRVAAWWRR